MEGPSGGKGEADALGDFGDVGALLGERILDEGVEEGPVLVLGLVGVLTRRNMIFVLMSLEIMLNATGLAFIAAASRWGQVDGQIMFMMIISLAAAEVAVALGFVLQLFHQRKTLDLNILGDMKG